MTYETERLRQQGRELARALSKCREFMADGAQHLLSSFAVCRDADSFDPDTIEPAARAYYDRATELYSEIDAALAQATEFME